MTKTKLKFGVIGSGSWATALIKILSEKNEEINWYIRNRDNIDYIIKNYNRRIYLLVILVVVLILTVVCY